METITVISTFFTAVSTIVIAVATVRVWRSTQTSTEVADQMYKLQQELASDRQDAIRNRVAQRVHAWWCCIEGDGVYGVMITNGSDEPIYDLELHAISRGNEQTTKASLLPPGEHWYESTKNRTFAGAVTPPAGITPLSRASFEKYNVDVFFTDGSGRRWERQIDGQLVESRPSDV